MKIIYNYLYIIIETSTCIMSSSEAAPVPADAAPVAAPVAADADPALTSETSMLPLSKPLLVRQNTGEVIDGHPYMNVDQKWLKGKKNTTLMAQVQQKSNEGDQDLSRILSEIQEGDQDN